MLALVTPVFASGCGDPVDPPVATTITISPVTHVLEDAGRTVQLTATVKDRSGQVMTGVKVAWSGSDSNIVKVAEDGLARRSEGGIASLFARGATQSEALERNSVYYT